MYTEDGMFRASVPSGASTGVYEVGNDGQNAVSRVRGVHDEVRNRRCSRNASFSCLACGRTHHQVSPPLAACRAQAQGGLCFRFRCLFYLFVGKRSFL